MNVSIIIPCRNNAKYFLQAYNSIRDHYPEMEIVALDDASTDNTYNVLSELIEKDDNLLLYRNGEADRVGHTVLYDEGIKMASNDIVGIFHSDMIMTANYISNMLKHLKPGVVVSATRIEPPLHPPGPEKHVANFGMEPEDFDNKAFQKFVYEREYTYLNETTQGIFAPWMLYKSDFVAIGGHDKLFAPMELEDSDIFNRMMLAGYKFIQSRDAFCYHMTCRGSRFKDGLEIEQVIDLPDGTKWYKPKDSEEYLKLRHIKFREWWRKWGTNVLHDELMMPKVGNVRNVGLLINNCTEYMLGALEPWCSTIYVDCDIQQYIATEQPNTLYDLTKRVRQLNTTADNDVTISFDGEKFNQEHFSMFIQNLSTVLDQVTEEGIYEFDIFKIHIKKVATYQDKYIQPVIRNVF